MSWTPCFITTCSCVILGGPLGSLSFPMYEMRIIVMATYCWNYFVNYIY